MPIAFSINRPSLVDIAQSQAGAALPGSSVWPSRCRGRLGTHSNRASPLVVSASTLNVAIPELLLSAVPLAGDISRWMRSPSPRHLRWGAVFAVLVTVTWAWRARQTKFRWWGAVRIEQYSWPGNRCGTVITP